MTRRASPWAVVSTAGVLLGLIAVVWLSVALADARQDEAARLVDRQEEADYRTCLQRNIGRQDIEDTFLAVLNAIDPLHASPLWTDGVDVDGPTLDGPKVPLEDFLANSLAPVDCPVP